MDNSKRVIISIFLFQVLFTQAKGDCSLEQKGAKLNCTGNIPDMSSAFLGVIGGIESATTLYLHDTQFAELGADATSKAFTALEFRKNTNLRRIHQLAFRQSNPSVKDLLISDSFKLKNTIWELVSKMTSINSLRLINVGLTEVPANAFQECTGLENITLNRNGIKTFAASLAGLNLALLNLMSNNLTNDSFSKSPFQGVVFIRRIKLADNTDMNQLIEAQFKGVLDAGTTIEVGRYETKNDYMKCIGADWLCGKNRRGGYFYKQVTGYNCVEEEYKHLPFRLTAVDRQLNKKKLKNFQF